MSGISDFRFGLPRHCHYGEARAPLCLYVSTLISQPLFRHALSRILRTRIFEHSAPAIVCMEDVFLDDNSNTIKMVIWMAKIILFLFTVAFDNKMALIPFHGPSVHWDCVGNDFKNLWPQVESIKRCKIGVPHVTFSVACCCTDIALQPTYKAIHTGLESAGQCKLYIHPTALGRVAHTTSSASCLETHALATGSFIKYAGWRVSRGVSEARYTMELTTLPEELNGLSFGGGRN